MTRSLPLPVLTPYLTRMLTLELINQAAARIAGRVHRTPVVTSRSFNEAAGCEVFFKCENLQRAGAFKARGATNKILSLTDDEKKRGVIAVSSGNHAQAVALAAREAGVRAVVAIPEDAPKMKVAATREYGADIRFFDRHKDDRDAFGREIAEREGLVMVPAYDDYLIMAGQGTVALELLVEVPGLDLLVTPVGGGGLIAGCATVAKTLRPGMRVAGVEPATGNDTAQSLAAGTRVNVGVPRTIADGLQAAEPGKLTFEVNRETVDEIVTATDAEILDAMAFLFDRLKIVTEPSGAIGVAALLSGRIAAPRGGHVGVVVSGGNVGVARFAELLKG